MKKIDLLIGLLILTACGQATQTDNTTLTCVDLKQRLDHQFEKLIEFRDKRGSDNLSYIDDSLPKVNQQIFLLLREAVKINDFVSCDLNSNQLNFISSNDNKLKFASWDTEEGGTMILFATALIYYDKDSLKVERLMTEDEESIENIYEIHTIQNDSGQNIYLVKGLAIGSTIVRQKSLRAYTLDEGLNPAPIFPNGQSEILIGYETPDSVVEIEIQDKGKRLIVPIVDDVGNLTGKGKELNFNGTTFASTQQRL
jgi:hypothetical protein